MQLLYIGIFQFHQEGQDTFALPSCADSFFEKYLDVFSSVRIIGEEFKDYLDKSKMVKISNPKLSVKILKRNTRPQEFRNDKEIKEELKKEISKAEAILIKPSSRKGILAIKLAKKYNKPYMIEMTGDIYNALLQSNSLSKRIYGWILYHQILHAIKDCKYGLYVSQRYLQTRYPIQGVKCGCTDVIIPYLSNRILNNRLQKIEEIGKAEKINLILVGYYQGLGKGVDIAIKSLSQLDDKIILNILGNGTVENQEKWYKFAENLRVARNRINFIKPLPSSSEVCEFLKTMDIFILPSRSEGLPRSIIEAMSVGLPCIGSNICGIPELIQKDLLIDIKRDTDLAKRIKSLITNISYMKSIAYENFVNATNFEFEKLRDKRNTFLCEFKNYCEKITDSFQL